MKSKNTKIRIPVEVSARHIHLEKKHFKKLFGSGKEPSVLRSLSQPGQFAAKETAAIKGPKNSMEKVRLIGPCRDYSQVEISMTDAFYLGINAPVRESGKIKGSAPIEIRGPQGRIKLEEGAIIAKRHIHLDPKTSFKLNLNSGDTVSVQVNGARGLIFKNTVVRVHPDFKPAMHIDTDEANAAGIGSGNSFGYIVE